MRRRLQAIVVLAAWIAAPLGGVARGDPGTCALLDPQLERSTSTRASCLGCHDGSAARAIPPDASHPVDVSYAAAWLRGSPRLHAIIPRELALSGGRVTCTTCHDGASRHRRHTALAEARLCTACHAQ